MATLAANLSAIRTAIYGKEVRKAIADAIEQAVDYRYTNIENFFDSALSSTSQNAVQNRVVKAAIDGLSGRIDAIDTQTDVVNDLVTYVHDDPHQESSTLGGPSWTDPDTHEETSNPASGSHLLGTSGRYIFYFERQSSSGPWTDRSVKSRTVRFGAHGRFLMICTGEGAGRNAIYILILKEEKTDGVVTGYTPLLYNMAGNADIFDRTTPISVSYTPGSTDYATLMFYPGTDAPAQSSVQFIALSASATIGS